MAHRATKRTIHAAQTAGRLMTDKIPVVHESATIADIEKILLEKTRAFETINYIFVVNRENILKGVVSIKEIFRSKKTTSVKRLLPKKTVSVHAHTDQERVAFLALKHNLKSVPVVAKEGHFLGVVTYDTILRVLDSEAVENILHFGGILPNGNFDDIFHLPLMKSLKHRLPWLILGLLGGLLASGIVNSFEDVLSRNLVLAAFIPLIVYMADAVGTQMGAFIIRDLAVNPEMKFFRYFLRQLSIVVIIGAITSMLLFGGSMALYGNLQISFVLSFSLFAAIISSIFSGLAVPFLFSKIKLDPANASGPIATIIQDILSVCVYFYIASLLL